MFMEIEATSVLCSQRILGIERKNVREESSHDAKRFSFFHQASKSQPRKRVKKRLKMRHQQRKNLLPSKIWVLFSLNMSVHAFMNLILLLLGQTILIVYQLLVFVILPRTKEN